MTLAKTLALDPVFLAIASPHDLQLISVVLWLKIILFSPHWVHCTDINLLLGFGTIILFFLFVIRIHSN